MEITKKRAERCTTHYTGCTCHEYRFQEMERALKVIHTWASVDGALDPKHVRALCNKALGK